MKLQISLLCLLMFSLTSCGNGERMTPTAEPKLMLDVSFPVNMTSSRMQKLKEDIEVYRFEFSGGFGSLPPVDIERKKYSQYAFSNVPFDSRLHIKLQALSLDKFRVYCTGEKTVNYNEDSNQTVLIEMRCV